MRRFETAYMVAFAFPVVLSGFLLFAKYDTDVLPWRTLARMPAAYAVICLLTWGLLILGAIPLLLVIWVRIKIRLGRAIRLSSALYANSQPSPNGYIVYELHLLDGYTLLRGLRDKATSRERILWLRDELRTGLCNLVQVHGGPDQPRGGLVIARPTVGGLLSNRLAEMGFTSEPAANAPRPAFTWFLRLLGYAELALVQGMFLGRFRCLAPAPQSGYAIDVQFLQTSLHSQRGGTPTCGSPVPTGSASTGPAASSARGTHP